MSHEKDALLLLHSVLSPSLAPSPQVPKQHRGNDPRKKMLAKFYDHLNTKTLTENVYLVVLVGTDFCF